MKRHTLILAPALAFACALALPAMADMKVQTVDIAGTNGRGEAVQGVAMPLVQPPGDPVAARINDALYLQLFETLAPPKPVRRFDVGAVEGTASQEFEVTRNDRILTVEFNTEGCGAYCEAYRQAFSFDTRTGRRLVADDLLTKAGQQEALRRLQRQRIAEYAEQVRIHRDALQDERRKAKRKDVIDDLQERLDLNANCLAQVKEEKVDDTLGWRRINPTKAALEVTAGRCSNHASMGLDDVDEVVARIPYAALRVQLTPYGRAVLLGEGEGRPAAVFGQVLRGTIGTSPVTMLLSEDSGDGVQGMYFYDRQRKRLGLSGKRRGNTIELQETVGDGAAPTGRLVLTVDGLAIKGKWSDPKGARQLDVAASAP